ncbi:MAG: phosphotransferase [Alphaproteobacteria bacterium]
MTPAAGERRRSVRVQLPDRSVIATRRTSASRGKLEAMVLSELRRYGAPVPAILAVGEGWLIQEDLGIERLSGALARADRHAAVELLDKALTALASIHEAARRAKLVPHVPALGQNAAWRKGLAAMPQRIAARLGEPLPMLDAEKIDRMLAMPATEFVKWDARPGNAIIHAEGGTIGWIDWEHCGARTGTDDLAWVMGDEYVHLTEADERTLIDRYLPVFAGARDAATARAAFHLFGTFHTCVRLALVLYHKGAGAWWSLERCLADDKVGVQCESAIVLAARGVRWAQASGPAAALAPWFARLESRLSAL